MSGKIKLLELCTSPSKGGLELYFADISNALKSHFQLFNVIGIKSAISSNLEENQSVFRLKKKVHYLPWVAALKLAKYIDKNAVDVIHLHWNKDLTLAVFAKLFSRQKPKIILTRHMQFPSKKDSFFHRFLYRNIDHIMAITHTMADDLKRFIPEEVCPEISVNYLGIKPLVLSAPEDVALRREVYDSESKLFLIGLFGRIDPYKGHDLFIDALLLAKEQGKPFKGLVVGHAMTEEYLAHLQARVNECALEEYIVFTGFIENPRELMQACDVVILTTVEETFGLVLIEAMSVGVPVIGSDRGGVPEIIDHQKTGLLFESENHVALFEALDFIYHKPNEAKRFAQEASAVVQEKFNAEKHLSKLVNTLNTLGEHHE